MLEYILTVISSSTLSTLIIVWLLKAWLTERLQQDIRYQYQEKIEKFRVELKADFDHKLELQRSEIKAQEGVNLAKWEIKRATCLEALEVVDTVFARMEWGNVMPDSQGPVDIARARACYNKLAITCESPEALEKYKLCLALKQVGETSKTISADIIVDLRNAIRAELGFGSKVDLDRDAAWIARLPGFDNTSIMPPLTGTTVTFKSKPAP